MEEYAVTITFFVNAEDKSHAESTVLQNCLMDDNVLEEFLSDGGYTVDRVEVNNTIEYSE